MNTNKKQGDTVKITINNVDHFISSGVYKVSELKSLGNVPLADQLEEVRNDDLHKLADNASTNIKGGEVFVSHPKDSDAS